MNLARWLRQASLHEGGQWPRSAHPDAKASVIIVIILMIITVTVTVIIVRIMITMIIITVIVVTVIVVTTTISKDFPRIRQELQDSSSSRLHDAHLKGASKLCF